MNLRKEAKGRQCQVRLPSICNYNPETVTLHHIKMAGLTGTGMKANDLLGTWICSECHRAVHHTLKTDLSRDEIRVYELEGVMRTINTLIEEEKIK